MNIKSFATTLQVGAIGLAVVLGFSGPAAHASDVIAVTYLAPGVQDPSAFTTYYETFTSATANQSSNYSGSYISTFEGTGSTPSGITGTYSGTFAIHAASINGGAGNSGHYILAPNGDNSYSLTLSQGVNYFGIWISALDAGNIIQLYSGTSGNYTLQYTFPPSTLIGNLGTCPTYQGVSNPYCGNPNSPYQGYGGSADDSMHDNNSQQYAYVNFYDTTGADITKIVFTESTSGGPNFEADNESAAILTSAPGGTPLGTNYSATPEPSSLLLMGTGLFGVIPALRRRRSSSAV